MHLYYASQVAFSLHRVCHNRLQSGLVSLERNLSVRIGTLNGSELLQVIVCKHFCLDHAYSQL